MLSYKNILHIYTSVYIEIYTDSLMTGKGTGYAFCVFPNKISQFSQKVKLIFQNSVFQVELLAIEDAVN